MASFFNQLPKGAASCGLMIRLASCFWQELRRWKYAWANRQADRKAACAPPLTAVEIYRKKESILVHPSAIYPLWQGENERPISHHASRASCSSKLSAPGTLSYQTKSPGSPLEAALGWLQDILTGSQTTEWTNTDILLRRCVWEEWNLGSITLLESIWCLLIGLPILEGGNFHMNTSAHICTHA